MMSERHETRSVAQGTLITSVSTGKKGDPTVTDPQDKWKNVKAVRAIGIAKEFLLDHAQKKLMTKLAGKEQEDFSSKDVEAALCGFRVRDTKLLKGDSSGFNTTLTKVSPVKQRKTEFFLKINFEKARNEKNLEQKLERGKYNAVSQKLMRLKRIQLANDVIHRHSIQNREKIWKNGISGTESAFLCSVEAEDHQSPRVSDQTQRDKQHYSEVNYDTVENE